MQKNIEKTAAFIFLGLLSYMPFHVFLSTWLGTSFGVLDTLKALKDIVLLFGLLAALIAALCNKSIKDVLCKKIFILVAIFILINLVYFFVFDNRLESEILSLVYSVRFLLFFIYGYLITRFSIFDRSQFLKTAKKVVLLTGAVVAVVGVSQVLIMPDDTLDSFGYSVTSGTPSTYYISDDKQDERAFSTLKDPNSLGSYMIIIILLAISEIKKKKKKIFSNKILIAIGGISIVCLLLSYSRSAVLGLGVALGAYLYLNEALNPKVKRLISYGFILVFISALILTLFMRNTYFIRSTVLHIGETSSLETSNSIRTNAFRQSIVRITERPFGEGLGTAGPSALKNNEQKVALTENYFLQVAVELGIFGITTFLAISVLLVKGLLKKRRDPFCLALLSSFVGLIITNNLVHVWSNEVVAYTWWGLAGLIFFAVDRKLKA